MASSRDRTASSIGTWSMTSCTATVALGARASHQGDSRHEITTSVSFPPSPTLGLLRVPVPAGGHRPGGAVVPAVRPFLSGCRRAPRRARDRGRPRHGPPVGPSVRSGVRRSRRRLPAHRRDRWHVDETYLRVGGTWRYLFRAIDQVGQVIDVFLSPRRDALAARRFFERAIGRTRVSPTEVTTDRYRVYPRLVHELFPAAFHRTEAHANNLLETDHGTDVPSGARLADAFAQLAQVI